MSGSLSASTPQADIGSSRPSSLPIIENNRSRQLASSATSGMSSISRIRRMNTWDFSSPMEAKWWWLPFGGHLRFAGDLPHGHGAEAAAQRQAHGGLHNPFPVAHPAVNSA